MKQLLCEGFNAGWLIEAVEPKAKVSLSPAILEHEGVRGASAPQLVERMRIRAIVQEAGVKNQNGRRYPKALWDRVLAPDSKFMERLTARDVLGEVEHPESGNTHAGRASHLWERIWCEGNVVKGECIVLKNPDGARMEELAAVGHRLGFSSRGRGEVQSGADGIEEVKVNDYDLDTFDCVAKPSVKNARAESTSPPVGVGVTESRDNTRSDLMSTLNEGQIYAASQLLARADSTMTGMQKALGSSDVGKLVEAQGQAARLFAEMGTAQVPDGLREKFAEIRGRLNSISESIGSRITAGQSPTRSGKKSDKDSLIEELHKRNQALTQKLAEATQPVVNNEKFEQAIQLGEELVAKSQQQQGRIQELEADLKAAQELLEAMASKQKTAAVQTKIKVALQNSVISTNPYARKLVESCRTPQEVDQAVQLIQGLARTRGVGRPGDPLPPLGGGNKPLTEGGRQGQPLQQRQAQAAPQQKQYSETLIGALARHEAQASRLNG